MRLRAEVATREQLLDALDDPRLELIYAPSELVGRSLTAEADRIAVVPPIYLADCEERVFERLSALREIGFSSALAHTVGHIELLKRAGFSILGGARLNCLNSETLSFLEGWGLRDTIVSAELSLKRLETLKKPIPIGFLAYGHLPLMVTRRCPIRDGAPCTDRRNCGRFVTDRKGRRIRAICSKNSVELLNPDVLDLGDRLDRFKNADFAVLKFTEETEIEPIVSAYLAGQRTGREPFTRGLYFRAGEQSGRETG
ncbi:MAG: U32 family peptidase [Bacteroides sp.]|nr:U32 family peptidase [Eubacterium sp.]MCM1418939.1 U32 family peptidase [Roseburia sp.]MCM1462117.1 U32 family peptidase [Bacteroides sp.]